MKRLSFLVVAISSLILPLSAGCDKQPPAAPAAKSEPGAGGEKHDEHVHPTMGPHGGQLIEAGNEEYHLELIHDEAAHKITVFLLDGTAKRSVTTGTEPITINLVVDGKPVQFSLPAARQNTDPAGTTSRFEVIDESLCEAMDAPKVKGRIRFTVGGKSFSGDIGAHDHAGHKD